MSKRDSLQVRANRALQIVENPIFSEAFDDARTRIVDKMERLALDGSNDSAAAALVYQLQAAKNFRAEFLRIIQAGDREAAREKRSEEDKKIFDPLAAPKPNEGDE